MASKFLTNTTLENSLSGRVRALTKASAKLDFLVGYFFFSGFCEIYENFAQKPLRILIGMDAQVDLNNCIFEYATIGEKSTLSKNQIKEKYFENLKNTIGKADLLDTKDFEASYRVFVQKLEDGTLEVRKTREANHAKMYLFSIPKENSSAGQEESKVIIGSSNFSLQGFKARNEINVYLQDENDFKEASEIFEKLWQDSVPLVSKENAEELQKVLTHTWLEAFPSPYLMYVRVLAEYFKESSDYIKTPREITRDRISEFFDVSYQVDAIREGVAKLKKHSGVIVADVVGLGKSIIASAIAANMDERTVIISPPHLKSQWEEYAADFGLRGGKVYTSGKIEEAARENESQKNLIVIIDEAHRYRNENTENYGFLHRLCAGKKVILLSATPFNNRPEDIFSLIKLFQIPAHSTIQTVNDLGNKMAELVVEYKKLKKKSREKKSFEKEFNEKANEIAQKIRQILDPVVIRRTRVDLENMKEYEADLKAQGIEFSDVKPPKSQTYELGELSGLYVETLENLTDEKSGFRGTRYKPLTYLKNDAKLIKKYATYFDDVENFSQGQRNMADFMKQLLVRRFESSKFSFIKSLQNIKNSMSLLRRWFVELKKIPMAKKVKIPDIDEIESALGDGDELFGEDEIFQCTISEASEKGLWYIDAQDISDEFLRDLDADISLIDEFLEKWNATKIDPKLSSIKKNIKNSLQKEPKRKIIIFTEFSDTADYLYEKFKEDGVKVMAYSSKLATKSARDAIRENFDAGFSQNLQKNDFDVLVATDAISEGFSLHRAGTIYNYDIPYNPTRVIQRVGRINRINKKVFDELFIYNFFPTATGEEISHTAEISTFKMKLFQAILGADTKILTEDETIDGYFGKEFTEAQNEENAKSWDVDFKNELNEIKTKHKDILDAALELPKRCRIARKNVSYENSKSNLQNPELFEGIKERGVLLFSKKADSFRFCFASKDGEAKSVDPQVALTLFKAADNEQGEKVTDAFYALYERAKKESGIVKTTSAKSKNVQNALSQIRFLLGTADESEKEYLKAVRDAISWDAVPAIYINQILKIKADKNDAILQTKEILPENYIETLFQKKSKIDCEVETILLAEELLGDEK